MGAFDDNVAITGDWMPPPSPSPRAFFSALLGDEFNSRLIPEPFVQNKNRGIFPWSQGQNVSQKTDDKDQLTNSSLSSEQKMNSCGGLLERLAARAGFNAPRLNTESIRPAYLFQNQDVCSPYITIPPGLSPTTLLESPVFLSNSLPSPTTGKLSFAPSGSGRNSMLGTEASSRSKDDFFEDISTTTSSFSLKHFAESGPPLSLSNTSGHTRKITSSNLPQQNFPGIEVPVQLENSLWSQNIEPAKVESLNRSTLLHLQDSSTKDAEHSPPPNEQQDEESDQRDGGDDTVDCDGPTEDGYNWRKYGQKQVKGSEYPRSYFKCIHPNCQVRKKVEQARDGQIKKIIYKGTHNHAMPTPNQGLAIRSDLQLNIDDQSKAHFVADGDPRWTTARNGTTGGACEWRQQNLEVASSVSMGTEHFYLPANSTNSESAEAVDACSTFSDDEEDDCRTRGSMSIYDDGEGDESESKKRKIEAYATEISGATRPLREPRVVVQTTSEVDILDDGYRWRKYGQKVVKGNPNPRSYYKCTAAGCMVRKHVERASHDLKSVITTYEGKHNHDVPAARNGNSIALNNGPAQGARAAAASGSVSAHLRRPQLPQPNNSMARFDQHSGQSSHGLPARQLGLGPREVFSLGMNQPGLSSLAMARLGPGECKPHVAPYLGQQILGSEMGFMLPKEESQVEPHSEPALNYPRGSSVYHQIMNRLPLRPQM